MAARQLPQRVNAHRDYPAAKDAGIGLFSSIACTVLRHKADGLSSVQGVGRQGGRPPRPREPTVEMFEQASRDAQDADVKGLADKTLPKLREHLEMARALDRKQDR